ncbi:hypothetical protein EMCRGX_G031505 [Ephydatia muelleri]
MLMKNIRQGLAFGDFVITEFSDPILQEHVVSVTVSDIPKDLQLMDASSLYVHMHVFQLHEDGPVLEELEEDANVSAASHWLLPNVEFHGMWESLVYDSDIKHRLLNYAETTMLFSDRGVDSNIISWNRVILLHGPPGTGKTSLSKALAQKLCIRLSERFCYGQLVEINSHSLFSKWFSESGKLVQKMFQKIQELIDDPGTLICVLIDEVESLTAARKSAMSGSEPSDAIRVVNSVLTQIDQLKRYPNVLILTTSNITGAIDLAFVDRDENIMFMYNNFTVVIESILILFSLSKEKILRGADIKQYIGPPSTPAIFRIYQSCIKELMKVGIITPTQQILDLRALEVMRFVENDATKLSLWLREISWKSEGFSGRSLRKIPFLAHALYAMKSTMSLDLFLGCLEKAVDNHLSEQRELGEL